MTYTANRIDGVVASITIAETGEQFPFDEGNRHYQDFLAAQAELPEAERLDLADDPVEKLRTEKRAALAGWIESQLAAGFTPSTPQAAALGLTAAFPVGWRESDITLLTGKLAVALTRLPGSFVTLIDRDGIERQVTREQYIGMAQILDDARTALAVTFAQQTAHIAAAATVAELETIVPG